MIDPRTVTAAALLVVGAALCSLAIRVWWTHPVNRAFLVGRFLTELGLRLLLTNLPIFFVVGMAMISSAVARAAYAMQWPTAHVAGFLEALFSLWAAGSVMLVAVRLWRAK